MKTFPWPEHTHTKVEWFAEKNVCQIFVGPQFKNSHLMLLFNLSQDLQKNLNYTLVSKNQVKAKMRRKYKTNSFFLWSGKKQFTQFGGPKIFFLAIVL